MRINDRVIIFIKLLDFLIKRKKIKYYNSNLKLLLHSQLIVETLDTNI